MNFYNRIVNQTTPSGCCTTDLPELDDSRKILLVGSPNVGKSALFNTLTHSYVTVSNYPGTTVTLTKGETKIGKETFSVIDTPGLYSLLPLTEEEQVTKNVLLSAKNSVIIHVIDAKNIERMLPLTIQLLELNHPLILVLNLMDEAHSLDLKFELSTLANELKIPVIATIAVKGEGLDNLKSAISACFKTTTSNDLFSFSYGEIIEKEISRVVKTLSGNNPHQHRMMAIMQLQEENKGNQFYSYPLFYLIALARQRKALEITSKVVIKSKNTKETFSHRLSKLMIQPLTGIPIMLFILYVGLYKLVGQFGAGTLVDFIEVTIFEQKLNPVITDYVIHTVPIKNIQDLLVGEYGVFTLGLRYALALILPIITTFFLFFALIEDSGYLPRLAMLVDKLFKKFGLSGRAVIPLVLGLGCSTMATMVTRTLPTKREKIMATLLLALAIPCSAQLGVLLALLAKHPSGLVIWGGIISGTFIVIGFLGAKLLPGNPPIFFMDVPPLRLPRLSNVLTKTYSRVVWYFMEVFPLFIIASFVLWLGKLVGILDYLVELMGYPIVVLGLPKETAAAFIFGFFRRDYGAAGLYDMQKAGLFNVNQLTTAVITMSLFPACIAQVLMMVKERGTKTGIAIFVICIALAFGIGILFNWSLSMFDIIL